MSCLIPTSEDVDKRQTEIDRLKFFLERQSFTRGCIFEPYGSFASGLYTKYGDVDLSVQHARQDILGSIQKALWSSRDYIDVDYRRRIRVPVLNFKHKPSDIEFDITVHTPSGKTSALLISRLKEMDGRFREVVLLVKAWAACHKIHGAHGGGFSSYVLYVLVIFNFQTIKPRILPPISELCTEDVMRKIRGVDESWKEDFDRNVAKFEKLREEKNEWDTYKVFYSFIKKFKHIQRKAQSSYISVIRGEWVSRKEWAAKDLPGLTNQPLWVEEPFGELENIARSVKDVNKIGRKFKKTDRAINTSRLDVIVKNLAPPKLLKLINAGLKAVASSHSISSSSSALIPQNFLIPATNPNVLGLGSYGSDDDEDSSADVLGLHCYASSEEDDRRSHAEEEDRKQERKDKKNHKRHCSSSPGWQKMDRSPSPGRHRSSKEKLKERDLEKRVNNTEINDDKKERDRDRTLHEDKHKKHRSPSPGKHRSSKDNSSFSCAHSSSASSSRLVHSKRRDRSASPNRSRRSPHSKHSHHRHSSYSSLERTRDH